MSSLSAAHVSSKSLNELQSELRGMSEVLNDLYEKLWGDLNILGEEWTDEKMEEFNEEFKNSRETVVELSKKYKEWADSYLPPIIEIAIEYEKASVGK